MPRIEFDVNDNETRLVEVAVRDVKPKEEDHTVAGAFFGGLIGAALGGPVGLLIGGVLGAAAGAPSKKE